MRGNYKTIKKLVCGKVREFVLMPTYDGDIKELWQEWTEDKEAYYVYSYGKLIEGEFNHRYIGIGNFRRYKVARRTDNNALTYQLKNNTFYKIIVTKTEFREESAKKEVELISYLGRKNLGTGDLYNLTDGGEKGTFGLVHTEEAKRKMSESSKGRKFTKEQKKEISKRYKGKGNPRYINTENITEDILIDVFSNQVNWIDYCVENFNAGRWVIIRLLKSWGYKNKTEFCKKHNIRHKLISQETRNKLSKNSNPTHKINRQYITNEMIRQFFNSSKSWVNDCKTFFGFTFVTLKNICEERFGTRRMTEVKKILNSKTL